MRRHRVDVELTALEVPTSERLDSAIADRDQLERGFLRLDPEMRAVIVLHHYLGLSLAESAEALAIPLGTMQSRLSRATQAMRAALDADERPAAGAMEVAR